MQLVPSEATDEGNKFIQIGCTEPADDRTDGHHTKPEAILQPLDFGISLSASSKYSILEDPNGWEQLEWHGKEDSKCVEKLDLANIMSKSGYTINPDGLTDCTILLDESRFTRTTV